MKFDIREDERVKKFPISKKVWDTHNTKNTFLFETQGLCTHNWRVYQV
jgi:hypothetical protein